MVESSIYEACALTHNGNTTEMIECFADEMESLEQKDYDNLHTWLLLLTGSVIFFMQAGFAMLCAGCVRKSNVQNTMLKNLLDACGAALAFFVCGFSFAFGKGGGDGKSFLGTGHFFGTGELDPAVWFFQFAFSATSVTIVAGTLAERCQMSAYLCYSIFLCGFVYPVVARAIWSENGFLSSSAADPFGDIGVVDFAGSGVVHVTGGSTALIAAYMLGPRKGRFYDHKGRALDEPKEFKGHSIALQLLGTMILWFGWYGFNPGSALLLATDSPGSIAALAAVNTSISAACAAVSSMFTNLYLEERKTGDLKFNLTVAMNGLLAGLVAITACAASVDLHSAALIGLFSGWLYVAGSNLLIRWKIDDAVDAIPVHLFAGAWGLIANGLFATPERMNDAFGSTLHVGWFYSIGRGSLDAQMLFNQFVALIFILAWTLVTMLPFFYWLNYKGWLRTDVLHEISGLDTSLHGGKKH